MKFVLSPVPFFALLFSGSMLLGAYAFQYIGGLAPCQMCYWQRWAHWTVLAFGLAGLFIPSRLMGWLVAAGLAGSTAVAAFHAGVEYGWWEGPKSCSTGTIDPDDLQALDPSAILGGLTEPMSGVDCSEPAWEMLGISMAGWNALASFGALLLVIAMMARKR